MGPNAVSVFGKEGDGIGCKSTLMPLRLEMLPPGRRAAPVIQGYDATAELHHCNPHLMLVRR